MTQDPDFEDLLARMREARRQADQTFRVLIVVTVLLTLGGVLLGLSLALGA